jgi:hypothetical protein
METTRTVRSIMREKAMDALERTELSEMARYSAALGCTAMLTVSLAYPSLVREAGTLVLSWENWILPKAAASAALCFNFRAILGKVRDAMREDTRVVPEGVETIEGIPTAEFVARLFATGRFSVDDAKAYALAMPRYAVFAKRLEDLGVLVRGEKNARVLNPEFGRSDVVSILA